MEYAYDMIQETTTYTCRRCGSTDIVKNGTNKCNSPQYHCKVCGAYRTLRPKDSPAGRAKSLILKTYRERASLRGVERIFQVARQTIARWLRTILRTVPKLKETLRPARAGDMLELDELWPFVLKEGHQRWLDCAVPPDTTSGRVYDWRPQRKDLPSALEQSATGLQALPVVPRFLGRLSKGLARGDASLGQQRHRRNCPH